MKNTIIKAVLLLIVATVIAFGLDKALIPSVSAPSPTSVRFGGATDITHFSGGISTGGTPAVNTVDGFSTLTTSGQCNAGTSTLFAFKNPFNATSTITMGEIVGTAAATATDIVIGTSTTPGFLVSGTGTTTMFNDFMGLGGIASSSQFFSSMGTKFGPTAGYNAPFGTSSLSGQGGWAFASSSQIVVAPGEFLLGLATSSYFSALTGGGTTAAQVPAPTSCFYSFEWQR